MTGFRIAGGFLLRALVATALFWGAWATSWLTFGKTPDLLDLLIYAGPVAFLFTAVRWRWMVRWADGLGHQAGLTLAAALGLYAALCGLHFARPRSTFFEFLAGTPMAFPTEPGMEGWVGAIYTFPAKPGQLEEAATTELARKGYRVHRRASGVSGCLEPGSDGCKVVIEIGPGRATGQRFHIDGDYVQVEKRDDWVTVDVVEPDPVPGWVGAWLP